MIRTALLVGLVGTSALGWAAPSTGLVNGIQAFQERRWQNATAAFLEVLAQDPGNPEAHTYLNLIAQGVQNRVHTQVQEHRMEILADTSKRLENVRQDPRTVDAALLDITQAEDRTRQERWRTACEEADLEMQLGHLLAANDLVLGVLADNSNYTPAQQLLSELQIRLYQKLESGGVDRAEERFALEGFYAYGQADYATAATAWSKADALIGQSFTNPEAADHLAALRYSAYFRLARNHVEESQRTARVHTLFRQALERYQQGEYSDALALFRQVAVMYPDYPQLGDHLARAESAVERERARRLGEKKLQDIAQRMEQGNRALAAARYKEAEKSFAAVLAMDASHKQASLYLDMVRAEIRKQHDPKAAQQHYEAGLVAYASGKLEEAVREWTITTRMNAQHEKAVNALFKVQKELALNRDLP